MEHQRQLVDVKGSTVDVTGSTVDAMGSVFDDGTGSVADVTGSVVDGKGAYLHDVEDNRHEPVRKGLDAQLAAHQLVDVLRLEMLQVVPDEPLPLGERVLQQVGPTVLYEVVGGHHGDEVGHVLVLHQVAE
eukprot:910543-Prorocentrum_minimum.AAC.1